MRIRNVPARMAAVLITRFADTVPTIILPVTTKETTGMYVAAVIIQITLLVTAARQAVAVMLTIRKIPPALARVRPLATIAHLIILYVLLTVAAVAVVIPIPILRAMPKWPALPVPGRAEPEVFTPILCVITNRMLCMGVVPLRILPGPLVTVMKTAAVADGLPSPKDLPVMGGQPGPAGVIPIQVVRFAMPR